MRAAYLGEEPGEQRLAELALMRLMVHAREAAWAVVRAAVSGPIADSEARASKHFEQLSGAAQDARFEDWLRAAAG